MIMSVKRLRKEMGIVIQARKPWRILAGFAQCLGMLVILVSVFNLFLHFAPISASIGGFALGAMLYVFGMLGGAKVEVTTKAR